ncbi:hypothetical protein [Microbacterium sp. zg-YB36]|uniref:hypothetical protein n=1 Tax=Microbacterium sp. zg-YB36 TaxID=2969407 RepID=UPI00214A98B7|nr:hypothetical protein [Microbacterium sp. zg-YB36]MDL5351195.1 hypothetical protein [Microbacterium sp. zg-YB36]
MTHIDQDFKPGDIVFVGPQRPLDRKVTWKVLNLHQAADNLVYATLVSGQSARSATVPVSRLTHYRLTEVAA